MNISATEDFVRVLGRAGSQRAAAEVLACSQAVVHDRLKKSRAILGDEAVLHLMNAAAAENSTPMKVWTSLDRNSTVCNCGSIRTPAAGTGKLVCRACANRRNREYKERNSEAVSIAAAAYRQRNRDKIVARRAGNRAAKSAADAAYNVANKEKVKASARAYRAENAEKLASYFKELAQTPKRQADNKDRLRAWKKRHPDKVNAQTAKRHAQKLRAIPSWASLKDIEDIYALARLRTELTGIEWHVDHAVPLNSDLVCGLHCEANLQVIPAGPNISKGNNWWPDMPGEHASAAFFSERPSLYL